jgi:hypothetical protein
MKITHFKQAHCRAQCAGRCDRFFGQNFVLLKITLSASVIGQTHTKRNSKRKKENPCQQKQPELRLKMHIPQNWAASQ